MFEFLKNKLEEILFVFYPYNFGSRRNPRSYILRQYYSAKRWFTGFFAARFIKSDAG